MEYSLLKINLDDIKIFLDIEIAHSSQTIRAYFTYPEAGEKCVSFSL